MEEKEILRSICPGATDAHIAYFLAVCQEKGLSPVNNQICMTLRKQKSDDGYIIKPVIQTTIDGMRSLALKNKVRTYGYSDEPVYGPDKVIAIGAWENGQKVQKQIEVPSTAMVRIHFKMGSEWLSQSATVRWSERYFGNQPMYERMPYGMLAKCAEALAIRKAFPEEVGGIFDESEVDSIIEPVVYQTIASVENKSDIAKLIESAPEPTQFVQNTNQEAQKVEQKRSPGRPKKSQPDMPAAEQLSPAVTPSPTPDPKSPQELTIKQRFDSNMTRVLSLGGFPRNILDGMNPAELVEHGGAVQITGANAKLEAWIREEEENLKQIDESIDSFLPSSNLAEIAEKLVTEFRSYGYQDAQIWSWLKIKNASEATQDHIDKLRQQLAKKAAEKNL